MRKLNFVPGKILASFVFVLLPFTSFFILPSFHYTLRGHLELQNYVASTTDVPINVELTKKGSKTSIKTTIYLDNTGDFKIPNLHAGKYDVSFKADHWLRRKINNFQVNHESKPLEISLINGDVNNDNKIDQTDLNILMSSFGAYPDYSSWDTKADLDGDKEITSDDLTFLMTNFGKTGD